ncbi:MAG: hypothetical protein KC766_41470 [Myxococcales bacterium]|nr:hypothetical protein [Myxococcales bacterium]
MRHKDARIARLVPNGGGDAADSRGRSWRRMGFLACVMGLGAIPGCSNDFSLDRKAPPRASVGTELYGLVCDRVGAQSLREDITGASFHDICHADAQGQYDAKVKRELLNTLRSDARDVDGDSVPLEKQEADREYHIARIEALGRRRADLIRAFDTALPDIEITLQKVRKADDQTDCSSGGDSDARREFLEELADTFANFVDLYNDETIPSLTRALGNLMLDLQRDSDAREALTRMDARQGYRPLNVALGVARPALAYPRLGELADTLLNLLASDSDPYNPANKLDPKQDSFFQNHQPVVGSAHSQFQDLLTVFREELRTPSDPPQGALQTVYDTRLDLTALSRPRTKLEIGQALLLAEDQSFETGLPRYIVARDPRGVALVNRPQNVLPAPFVPDSDGSPELDALGQFVTIGGAQPPTPFFAVGSPDGNRDGFGRALLTQSDPLYVYRDVNRSLLGRVLRDFRPHLVSAEDGGDEVVMKLLAGLPLLLGDRDPDAQATKVYPPDPDRGEEYALSGQTPPKDLAQAPITLHYRAYHAENSPLAQLVHGLGATLAHPEVDDALTLVRQLLRKYPKMVARLVKLGLDLKAIADKHPEAYIPEKSTFWDELIDVFIRMSRDPDMLEQLITAFGDPRTFELKDTFAAFMKFKDELSYYKDDQNPGNYNAMNGLDSSGNQLPDGQRLWNVTKGSFGTLSTPVNRNAPDTGENRSALQRFIQLLHDAKGMSACTKPGATVRIQLLSGVLAGVTTIQYPQDRIPTTAVCALVGQPAPPQDMPLCGILRFPDVAELILDVALNRAEFDVRDPCLRALMDSNLTVIVGGADNFLQTISGINGFTLQPTVEAISRMAFFDTPFEIYNQSGGFVGTYAGTQHYPKTRDFLEGVIDPIPTMVCPPLLGSDGKPWKDPSDGMQLNLRSCERVDDLMRYRDSNALFPLGEFGFIERIQPLAEAFADNDMNSEFVDLFDTMHLHWGSPAQSQAECDPGLPRTDARWCSQDGGVRYEPLLADMLQGSDLFAALRDIVPILASEEIERCESFSASGECATTTRKNAIQVLGDVARVLIDPERNKGLTDLEGSQKVTLNDGTVRSQTTPLYLLVDALKGIDKAFADHEAEGGSADTLSGWRQARSEIVDTFFTVDGSPTDARFRNPAVPATLDKALGVLQAQIHAHCPARNFTTCGWGREELGKNVEEVMSGPLFATLLDFIEALRRDPRARRELQRFLVYLIDDASDNEAQTTTLSSVSDLLQVLDDDSNLEPLYKWVSRAVAPSVVDGKGNVKRRSAAGALVEVLSRIFARAYDQGGDKTCNSYVDPNKAITVLLRAFVTPPADDQPAPIETVISVIADVNRKDPREDTKYTSEDYQNLSKEVGDFFLDEGSGLEQVYEVVRQATLE